MASHGAPAQPDLTVVVTFFRLRHLAPVTIRNLSLVEGRERFQLVLLDDASGDGTADVIRRHCRMWLPEAEVVELEHNVGVSAARNVGLARARGRWITYLDGDDFVSADYWASVVADADRLDVDFVRTDFVRVEGLKRDLGRVPHQRRGVRQAAGEGVLPFDHGASVDYPRCSAGVYRTDLRERGLLEYREDLRTCEDRHHIWTLHLRADTFAVVDHAGSFYRRDIGTSLTRTPSEKQMDFLPAYRSIVDMVQQHEQSERFMPKAVRGLLAMTAFHLGARARFTRDLEEELVRRCRRTLDDVPQDALAEGLRRLDGKRRAVVERLRAGELELISADPAATSGAGR
ncbi:glycosyltransferase family 2 protein [Auraticoccus monumenti]|uniref:Glycosyltransferase involved in cell wall bisynthesis n=1 Tax=Auraticoccus monumenti TaxID=675864 RepID=A0A1G7EQ63_9ACTN|nr:glycosyltransferase family 2 protein [Auraticoccus monumenti]SDE65811.1 Glycosyltransferase involved in cell wall bisynthesis [Auraticoccus monumenti]